MRFFLVSSIVILLLIASFSYTLVSAQDVYNLRLQSSVWNHSTLSALIITADDESWWDPAYVNNTLRAIGQWDDAITEFVANYSDYSYLSGVSINPQVSNETRPGYDIYINWTESLSSDVSNEIGLTTIYSSSTNVIENCTMSLGVKTYIGAALGNIDMQNIALHELGHCLALSHSNYSGDIMYALYNLGGSSVLVSTLDVYGVATMFAWRLEPSSILPVRVWLKDTSVTLPPSIPYRYLSVSPKNTPTITIIDNPVSQFFIMLFALVAMPVIAVPIIILIIILTIAILVPRRRKPRIDSHNSA